MKVRLFFITSPFKIVLVFNARQDIDGLVQERRNPIANALELRFFLQNSTKLLWLVLICWLYKNDKHTLEVAPLFPKPLLSEHILLTRHTNV